MAANIGEMFYTGAVPWHGLGRHVQSPVTVDAALKLGGLEWEVGDAALQTAAVPPSPVLARKAIVRLDRPAGHKAAVVGVVHRDFRPLQNRIGAQLFDQLLGPGQAIYHTGGYLGAGERTWLMARLPEPIDVGRDDVVQPYALFTNSHDGSLAVGIRLTTIRVVCQNTLELALRRREFVEPFRRPHIGDLRGLADAAAHFWARVKSDVARTRQWFQALKRTRLNDAEYRRLVEQLLPEPKRPDSAVLGSAARIAWEKRLARVREKRATLLRLWHGGRGTDLRDVRGTLWGALNAFTEFADHHWRAPERAFVGSIFGHERSFKRRMLEGVFRLCGAAMNGDPILN